MHQRVRGQQQYLEDLCKPILMFPFDCLYEQRPLPPLPPPAPPRPRTAAAAAVVVVVLLRAREEGMEGRLRRRWHLCMGRGKVRREVGVEEVEEEEERRRVQLVECLPR